MRTRIQEGFHRIGIVLVGIVFLIAIAPPTMAETYEMLCKNQRRAYKITFDSYKKTVVVNTDGILTKYHVLASERNEVINGLMVVGAVGMNSNLIFRAIFSPSNYRMVEFFNNENLYQTDICK